MKKFLLRKYWHRFLNLFFNFYTKQFILNNKKEIQDSLLIATVLLCISSIVNILFIDRNIKIIDIQNKVIGIRFLFILISIVSYVSMKKGIKVFENSYGNFVTVLVGIIIIVHFELMLEDPGNFFYYLQGSSIVLFSTSIILWIEPLRIAILNLGYFVIFIPISYKLSEKLGIEFHTFNQNALNIAMIGFIGFIANIMINYWRLKDFRSNNRLTHTLSNLKITNLKIQMLSNLDSLTNLYNRRFLLEAFYNRIEESEKEDYTFGLIILDLDFLKKINDRYGHIQGDRSILLFSDVLRKNLRLNDICARIGGDEFCILTHKIDKNELMEFAENIRKQLEEINLPIYNNPSEFSSITASVGIILTHGRDKQSFDSLYHSIDGALYRAKMDGRNKTIIVNKPIKSV
jgi:diguanylate cyclase (GGDEF)-like protein